VIAVDFPVMCFGEYKSGCSRTFYSLGDSVAQWLASRLAAREVMSLTLIGSALLLPSEA